MAETLTHIGRAKNGDHESLAWLHERFGWVVERECGKFIKSLPPDFSRSDIGQEAWMRVWSQIENFDADENGFAEANFVNWLKTLSKRVAQNILERQNAQKRRPDDGLVTLAHIEPKGKGETPSSIVGREERNAQLRSAIEGLSTAEMKVIIKMCFFEQLTLKEIAKQLDTTYDKVRYRFHAALSELEKEIEL